MRNKARLLGAIATVLTLLVFGLYLARAATKKDTANAEGFDLHALRRLPVLEGGRVKPLDTVARTSLRLISGREEYKDADDKWQPAIKWLADAMFADVRGVTGPKFERKGPVWQAAIYRVENEQLMAMLGLKTRDGLRYGLAEFYDKRETVSREVDKAKEVAKDARDTYQVKVLEFGQHLIEFEKANQGAIALVPPTSAGGPWGSLYEAKRVRFADKEWYESARAAAAAVVLDRHQINQQQIGNLPAARAQMLADEVRVEIERVAEREIAEGDPQWKGWMAVRDAYRAGDAESFNARLAEFAGQPNAVDPKVLGKTRLEVFLSNFGAFYQVSGMYVFCMVLAVVGLILFAFNPELTRLTRWPGFSLMLVAFAIHTFAIGARIYLQGRPPVTNLYSSAVFIGWGAVATCLVIELAFSYGAALFVGGFIGFGTGVVAHFLSLSSGDSLEMMQAVLDTNLWLATHVVLVTFGYVATYVAGVFGILFILAGLFTPLLKRQFFKDLSNIIYGVVCFATMLSFIGTVLGGIWADQSWGRFWGWDPKENGAVLVVIWNTIILHARWAGLVQQRGMAVLAVLGNIVVAWSWFGTNMLGVGLHAYGFTSFGFWMMTGSALTSIAVVLPALLWPPRLWRSYGERYDAPMTVLAA